MASRRAGRLGSESSGALGRLGHAKLFCLLSLPLLIKQASVLWHLGIDFGPRAALAMAGASLVLLSPGLLLGENRLGLVLPYCFGSLLCLVDLLYYRSTGDLTSMALLGTIGDLRATLAAAVATLQPDDWLLVADVPLVALLLLPRSAPSPRWPRRIVESAAVYLLGSGLVALLCVTTPRWREVHWFASSTAGVIGLAPYHLANFAWRIYGLARVHVIDRDKMSALRTWADRRRWPAMAAAQAAGSATSVVVVQFESLQAGLVGQSIDGQEITPFLNELVRRSTYFSAAYSQIGQGRTSDAEFLALCSGYPADEGILFRDFAHVAFRCLPELARRSGYSTIAAHGNRITYYRRNIMYPRIGFRRLLDETEAPDAPLIWLGRADEPYLQVIAQRLGAIEGPYFAHVVTLSSHWPFRLPAAELRLPSIRSPLLADYLSAIHYADRSLRRFVETLEGNGKPQPLLVVYGDHPALARDLPAAKELHGRPDGDELSWSEFDRRVPLLVHRPGQTAGEVRTDVAGQIDLAPTIAGQVGWSSEGTLWFGRDLFRTASGSLSFHDQSALDDRRVFLASAATAPAQRCYARATSAPLRLEDCADLQARGKEDFENWRTVLHLDLATVLAW